MGKRRYRSMQYVYKRPDGLYQFRYPIPHDVSSYFPKGDGSKVQSHVIGSLGTAEREEANRRAVTKFADIERKFSVLREGAQSSEFASFCRFIFDLEMDEGSQRNLKFSVHKPFFKIDGRIFKNTSSANKSESPRAHELHALLEALESRDVEELEAVAGWVVDFYLQNAADVAAIVPHDTPLRGILLSEAAAEDKFPNPLTRKTQSSCFNQCFPAFLP